MAKAPSVLPVKKKKVVGEKVSLRYAWYALAVLFLVNAINYVDRLSIGPAMEHIKRDFLVSDTQMGLLYSAFITVYALVSLPMGFVSDRGRRTWIVGIGIGVWSLFTTLSGFMRNFVSFYFVRGLVGSGEGIYAPTGTAIVADYFPKRLRNTAIAIFMSAMIVGGAMAYIFAGLILDKTDKFEMARVHGLVAENKSEQILGWNVTWEDKQKSGVADFVFTKPGGQQFAVILSKFSAKKTAAAKSLLFNINYEGAPPDGSLSPDWKVLFDEVVTRIRLREAVPLAANTRELEKLPSNFKLPDDLRNNITITDKSVVRNSKTFNVLGRDITLGESGFLKTFGVQFEPKTVNIKEFTYKGIITNDIKQRLMKASDNDSYQKAVVSIASDADRYYKRSDNWRWIFWVLGPPGMILALLSFLLKEPLKGGGEEFLTEDEARKVEEKGKADFRLIYKTPSVVIMMLSNVLVTYCVGGLNTWIFPFVERFKGIPSSEAAMSIGPIVVGCAVLGVIVSGVLADKLSKKTPLGNTFVLCFGIVASLPFMYTFFETTDPTMVKISISGCMFFLTWINGPQNTLLMNLIEPRLRATLNAFHILIIHLLGDALSPIVVGYYSDKVNLKYALSVLPVFIIIGCVGFAIAGFYIPRDLKSLEKRMKQLAT